MYEKNVFPLSSYLRMSSDSYSCGGGSVVESGNSNSRVVGLVGDSLSTQLVKGNGGRRGLFLMLSFYLKMVLM